MARRTLSGMIALDLRIRSPRSPRERLDNLLFMPRTIDKICATLPGGHLGPYHIVPGMSQMLLDVIRVDLPKLRVAVFEAGGEEEIAAWLRAHADATQYERANALLSGFRHDTLTDDYRANFQSLYPDYLRSRYPIALDLLEADDCELYPAIGKG